MSLNLNILVGGIYTVIRTKVPVTCAEFGPQFCLFGPWNSKNSYLEIEEQNHSDQAISSCIDELRSNGVRVISGKWLIDGAPNVILFDLDSVRHRLAEWRNDIWECGHVPCPVDDVDMNDAIVLGQLIAWFLHSVMTLTASTA